MVAIKTVHARITGQVQGVWFRVWLRDAATARGLSGWVRNEADGAVTALLSGPASEVDRMAADLRHGPPRAQVGTVVLTPADPPARADFDILL